MSTLGLSLVHARYALLETVRVPIAVIGSLVFPALAMLFFVVPQRSVADDPALATQAVIALSVFGVMSNCLFSFGLGISENREKPWDPYLRTLPAPGIVRILGHLLSTGAASLASTVPVILVGAFLTAAEATLARILLGFAALALVALPFMLLGTAVGYAMSSKAAIAVVQVLMFGMAFGGGLFIPPQLFPGWLNALSGFLPSRHALDLVRWAVAGGGLPVLELAGIATWIAVAGALALWLFRRDEGRRYR